MKMSPNQLAKYLSISVSTLERMRNKPLHQTPKLKYSKIKNRISYDIKDVEQYLEDCSVYPKELGYIQ